MAEQIALPLRLRDSFSLENFVVVPTSSSSEMIEQLRGDNWQTAYVYGTQGTGKSHLLQALCRYHQEQLGRQLVYLPLNELISQAPSVLDGLETLDLIAIDDIDKAAGHGAWEEGLFNLYNRVLQGSTKLLVAARNLPKGLGMALDDLVSRLSAAPIWRLEPLAEEQLGQALMQRANRLGFDLDNKVVSYLMTHWQRDASSLFDLLEGLDKYSFDRQRRLTIPLVRGYLQTLAEQRT